jgi:hypothetical protein
MLLKTSGDAVALATTLRTNLVASALVLALLPYAMRQGRGRGKRRLEAMGLAVECALQAGASTGAEAEIMPLIAATATRAFARGAFSSLNPAPLCRGRAFGSGRAALANRPGSRGRGNHVSGRSKPMCVFSAASRLRMLLSVPLLFPSHSIMPHFASRDIARSLAA